MKAWFWPMIAPSGVTLEKSPRCSAQSPAHILRTWPILTLLLCSAKVWRHEHRLQAVDEWRGLYLNDTYLGTVWNELLDTWKFNKWSHSTIDHMNFGYSVSWLHYSFPDRQIITTFYISLAKISYCSSGGRDETIYTSHRLEESEHVHCSYIPLK